MDPLVAEIMKNYDKELELYKAKKPESLFKKYFDSKGVNDHKIMKTEDKSVVICSKNGGFFNGPSIVQYFNGTLYVGDMAKNLREGFGYRNYEKCDLIYAGDYKNNIKCGKGRLWSNSLNRWVFDGRWDKDMKNGYGEMWKKVAIYKGNWTDDRMEGIGKMEWFDGQKHEGEYLDDLRHGQGTMTFVNGDNYTGMFFKGKPHGKGFYQWKGGEIYEGTWEDGVMQGDGKIDYNIPVSGVGSMRNNELHEINFGLQSPQEWNQNLSKSMQSIRMIQSTIGPDSAKKGSNEYDRLMKNDKQIPTSVEDLGGLKPIMVNPMENSRDPMAILSTVPDQKKTTITRIENNDQRLAMQRNMGSISLVRDESHRNLHDIMNENQNNGNAMVQSQTDKMAQLSANMQRMDN
jgi:hypothetical protein